MCKEEIVLLQCGSFNPITNMHLRMMELARDNLEDCGYTVNRGYISPVHDSYGKQDLISITHRLSMIKCALESSDWIQVSTWECEQSEWTNTQKVFQYHQDRLNYLLNDKNINGVADTEDRNGNPVKRNVTVKLVCGADFLSSFSVPDLWSPADIERILIDHGIIVITRAGYDVDCIIYENDDLFYHKKNILVVKEFIENSISSTKIRKVCYRGRSIKYLVHDKVEQYIRTHKLYSSSRYKYKNEKNDSLFQIPINLFNDYNNYPANKNKNSVVNSKNETNNINSANEIKFPVVNLKNNTKLLRKRKRSKIYDDYITC